MVKLIGYEWRKHFLKWTIVFAVVLFSILNVLKIYSIHDGNSLLADPSWKELYSQMYAQFEGKITDEKIGKLMAIYRPLEQQTADLTASTTYRNSDTRLSNVYEDFNFYRWSYVNPMKYAYDYKAYAHDVVTKANENIVFFDSLGNVYESRKNAAIADLFQGRSIRNFSYTEMYQEYVQYDFSAFLVLLICLYGLMSVFLSEKETEMDILLLTTQAGGVKTVWAKLLASALFICSICLWFWIIDFIAFSCIYASWDAASLPLYVLEDYIHSALNVSLGQYAEFSAVLKILGMLVFGLAILLLSSLFRNALIPFIIGLLTCFGCIYVQEAYMGSGHVLIKIMNPFVFIVNRELFHKIEYIPLWGYPFPSYIVATLFLLLWGTIFLSVLMFSVRKNALRKGGG